MMMMMISMFRELNDSPVIQTFRIGEESWHVLRFGWAQPANDAVKI